MNLPNINNIAKNIHRSLLNHAVKGLAVGVTAFALFGGANVAKNYVNTPHLAKASVLHMSHRHARRAHKSKRNTRIQNNNPYKIGKQMGKGIEGIVYTNQTFNNLTRKNNIKNRQFINKLKKGFLSSNIIKHGSHTSKVAYTVELYYDIKGMQAYSHTNKTNKRAIKSVIINEGGNKRQMRTFNRLTRDPRNNFGKAINISGDLETIDAATGNLGVKHDKKNIRNAHHLAKKISYIYRDFLK